MRWRNLFAVALLLVGLTQMAGDILGNRVLKGLGAAPVAASPVRMARAMRLAVEAGREAFLAGRIPRRLYASASSPVAGIIGR